jgi:hypothetical protein
MIEGTRVPFAGGDACGVASLRPTRSTIERAEMLFQIQTGAATQHANDGRRLEAHEHRERRPELARRSSASAQPSFLTATVNQNRTLRFCKPRPFATLYRSRNNSTSESDGSINGDVISEVA